MSADHNGRPRKAAPTRAKAAWWGGGWPGRCLWSGTDALWTGVLKQGEDKSQVRDSNLQGGS